jgi:hypothetical protein
MIDIEAAIAKAIQVPSDFVRLSDGQRLNNRFVDLSGQCIGRLSVLGLAGKTCGPGAYYWAVECACGNVRLLTSIEFRKYKSCGQCQKEHHGKTYTKVHNTWLAIKNRCCNSRTPGYVKYGAKGISVCQRWRDSFAAFFEDMGEPPTPEHSLDRIDPTGNYEPENCRWATPTTQSRNRTTARRYEIDGECLSIPEMGERFGLHQTTIKSRLVRGWSVRQAVGLDSHPRAYRGMPGNSNQKTHGMTGSKVYRAWIAIKNRCFNRNTAEYASYGARGIAVAGEWVDSFGAFYAHVGDPPSKLHSLDRIDSSGNYEPGNVRWATKSEQVANRSRYKGHISRRQKTAIRRAVSTGKT